MAVPQTYRFGPFRLDAASAELRRGGRPIRLRPKTAALLRHLVENAGRVVTKNELLDAVWPEVVVGEAVLKVGVGELREALGDDAAAPRYLETAHRSGYRFVAAVEVEGPPRRLTSFVGRDAALGALGAAFEEGARLVTITGAGGAGKTRLALEAAGELRARWSDGVVWTELAPVSAPHLVAGALGAALGLREHGRRSIEQQLESWLRPRSLLLVIDNAEHVRSAVAALATTLLRACPRLAMLVTSRAALRAEGERLWPIPPLATPAEDDPDPLRSDAVRLFVERARAIRPDLALERDDVVAIAEICRRVDGLPLAIELAAARVALLSPAEIAARLGDAFALLAAETGGDPRHRTLRAAIDWSHALLAEDERRLLRRLSVFAGTFTLGAAEAVAGPGARGSVLDGLARLVENSLVAPAGRGPDGSSRYRLLELLRQYAHERLAESPEAPEIRARHAATFAELAEREAARVQSRARVDALAMLAADLPNLRAAFARGIDADDPPAREAARRIGAALGWFWFYRGLWSEGRQTLERTVATATAGELDRHAASASLGAGLIAWTQGDLDAAERFLSASELACRRLGDERSLGAAATFLSATEMNRGRIADALVRSAEAVEIFERHADDPFGRAAALANRGIVLLVAGDHAAAGETLERAARLAREAGESWILSLAVRNLGILAAREGDFRRGAELVRESLALLLDLGERWFLSRAIEMLAAILARLGDAVRAARLYGAGERLRAEIGASVLPVYRIDHDAGLDALRGVLGAERLEAERRLGRELDLERAVALALEELPSAVVAEPSRRNDDFTRPLRLRPARRVRGGS